MPRTAPAVDGTPSLRKVSLRYVDVSKDSRTISNWLEGSATDAQVEAHVVAAGAASNANLYEVQVTDVYRAAKLASAAVAAEENSVFDNVVILYKESDNPAGMNGFIPAPIRGLFIGDSDNIDNVDTDYVAFKTTLGAILLGTMVPITVRYTERREINDAEEA